MSILAISWVQVRVEIAYGFVSNRIVHFELNMRIFIQVKLYKGIEKIKSNLPIATLHGKVRDRILLRILS